MQTVIKSAFQSFMGSVLAFYFIRYSLFSRLTLVIFIPILIISLIAGRILMHNTLLRWRKRGFNIKKVLLIGRGKEIDTYLELIKNQPELGVKAVGWYDPPSENIHEDIPIINSSLAEYIAHNTVDTLIVCSGKDTAVSVHDYQDEIYNLLVPVIILSDRQYDFLNVYVDNLNDLTLFHQNRVNHNMTDRLLKRFIDIISSLTAFIIFSPFFLICPVLVKLSSKGPIFYGQKRMTRDGKIFTMYKFRSMRTDAEEKTGAVWAQKNDSRTTWIGSLMRKTSIDEIPQFWNILKGEMSLVGPRPERPELIEGFKEEIPGYMIRHKVKAGLTGWAQVNGWRGDTSLYKRIEYDIEYINEWSIWFDVKVIFLTLFKGFIHKNAY